MIDVITQSNDMFSQTKRERQQTLVPSAVKTNNLPSNMVKNTATTINGPVALATGTSLIVQSITLSSANKNVSIAAAPYCLVFFEGSLDTTKIIGSGVTGTGYTIKGPFAMPVFTPLATNTGTVTYGGSDGNNLVFVTELYNNTGLTKNIYYLTNTRFITGFGGSAS